MKTLEDALAVFRASNKDCLELLAFGHRTDSCGAYLAAPRQRDQIVASSFLGIYVAWEDFLESAFVGYMMGEPAIEPGKPAIPWRSPVRFVRPKTLENARQMLVGTQRYFDFSNHQFVVTMSKVFFEAESNPFTDSLPAVQEMLDEMKTVRNASAHMQSSTQVAMDRLARKRLTAAAVLPCNPSQFLLARDPTDKSGQSILSVYHSKLDIVAERIVNWPE